MLRKKLLVLFAVFAFFPSVLYANWSISVYQGTSPLDQAPIPGVENPVLTADDVTDIPADFVADPFIIPVNGTWYMFFEVLNSSNGQGDISYATSSDGLNWTYQQVVLDESFHLSYPHVFEWQGQYYMIPEASGSGGVHLYTTNTFPTNWTQIATLTTGVNSIDPSIVRYNNMWWMFTSSATNDNLNLYYATDLTGPWTEHPNSPLIVGDANIARPGGRVVDYGGRLLRIVQDDSPAYGTEVRAFEITELTTTTYADVEVLESPLLGPTGFGWNGNGMHHMDAWEISPGEWFSAVDGRGDFSQRVDAGILKSGWSLLSVDSEETVGEDGAAINAFDNDGTTIWHTQWLNGTAQPPHNIDISLGGQYSVDGFVYIPRQDVSTNGHILDYEFYVSLDGVNWSFAASGTFADDKTAKTVRFFPIDGQFVRLVALTNVGGPYTSAAEINVLSSAGAGSGNISPIATIDSPIQNTTINAGEAVSFAGTGVDIDGNIPLTHFWSFGAGSGVPDSTLEDPGLVQFDIPGTYTVTFNVTDALGASDPTPATRVITVVDPNASLPIPQASWTLLAVDSEETAAENGAAINAFDGTTSTIWHTDWSSTSPTPPHNIDIYIGGLFSIDGFIYTPRQDGGQNGNIADYEFYVSMDGVNWGSPVASGTFSNDSLPKEVSFLAVDAQFIRLVALTEVNGNPWTTVAELNVLGNAGAGSGNMPPDGTIDVPTQDITINLGDAVLFEGTGSDPDGNTPLEFLWTFGAGSGIADVTVEDPGNITFNTVGSFTVTFTVTDALNLSDPVPATRVVTVLDPNAAGPIPQDAWSLWFVDSEEVDGEDGAAINAFDGSAATFWHTQWLGGSPLPPHTIDIALGAQYSVDGFEYTPRQDGAINGRVLDYEFYVSLDGVSWGTPVATGTFPNVPAPQEVRFAPVEGQFVRLVALSEVNGNPWTSIAEINVFGNLTGAGNNAPNGTIDTPTQDVTINIGESVILTGTGSDADGDTPLSFLWSFGAGSGIADVTVEDPGAVVFNNAGTFTVTFSVADSLGLSDPTPATIVVTVVDPNASTPISQASWTLWAVDSEELVGENGAAINAFDGNLSTIWHTEWSSGSLPPPHNLDISLGAQYTIDGFIYVPRQDGGENGRIANYEFYVSTDGVNWGAPVASGTFLNDASAQEIRFPEVVGQYVRLVALTEVNGNPWTSVAEIQVLGQ